MSNMSVGQKSKAKVLAGPRSLYSCFCPSRTGTLLAGIDCFCISNQGPIAASQCSYSSLIMGKKTFLSVQAPSSVLAPYSQPVSSDLTWQSHGAQPPPFFHLVISLSPSLSFSLLSLKWMWPSPCYSYVCHLNLTVQVFLLSYGVLPPANHFLH